MDWNTVIENRHTTFAWDEERIPSEELLMDVLKEVYENIPSKNLMFSWQARLMRNDNPEVRKRIMTICQRNSDHSMEEDRGNPQVLAPWLIGFNARWISDLEKRWEIESPRAELNGHGIGNVRDGQIADKLAQSKVDLLSYRQTQNENIEIGIALAYMMLAMANRGIQTGMCQNICNDFPYAKKLFQLDDDERSMEFRFIMGVGYGKDVDTQHEYIDPRIDKIKKIPFAPSIVEQVYPRPPMEEIIKVIRS